MFRKIQVVGGKTYAVNLPIDWIKSMNLEKGSEVIIKQLKDGNLLIEPVRGLKKETPKKCTIISSKNLRNDITRAYLLGYEQILIKSKSAAGFTKEELDEIEERCIQFPGAEIMSEGKNEILIEVIASEEKNQPYKLIRRLFNLTQDMLDRIYTVINPRIEPEGITYIEEIERIKNIDNKINRTYFLLVRQLRALIQDAYLRNKLNLHTLTIMDYRLISHLLENIGDNCVLICNHIIEFQNLLYPLLNKTYKPPTVVRPGNGEYINGIRNNHTNGKNGGRITVFDGLLDIAGKIVEFHRKTFDAFRTHDYRTAENLIKSPPPGLTKAERASVIQDIKSDPKRSLLVILLYRYFDIFDMLIDICDLIQPEEE